MWQQAKFLSAERWGLIQRVLIGLAAVAFLLIWVLLPPLLYGGVEDEATRVKAFTDTRTALLAGLIGVGALATFWLNTKAYGVSVRTLQVTERGQVTERFGTAIEHLGSDSISLRLGGIYTLEQIGSDAISNPYGGARVDHRTIIKVLAAFVRAHPKPSPLQQNIAEDAQAALTTLFVLIELDYERVPYRDPEIRKFVPRIAVDLSHAYLRKANLSKADLRAANLTSSDLTDASLTEANFARLGTSYFNPWAGRSEAFLVGSVAGTDFSGADLSGAYLHEADFSRATGLTSTQLEQAAGDSNTELPPDVEPPEKWTKK